MSVSAASAASPFPSATFLRLPQRQQQQPLLIVSPLMKSRRPPSFSSAASLTVNNTGFLEPVIRSPPAPLLLSSSPPVQNPRPKSFVVRSRRGPAEARPARSDPVYRNRLVNMLVNRILKNGKKSLAHQILYRALRRIQQKTEANPLAVLRQAIHAVTPDVAVKSRRVGGATQQVPIEIGSTQGKALAIRWLLAASRKRQGRDMALKLSSELLDAARGSGDATRKKEETHRMAEANRAFAHFR